MIYRRFHLRRHEPTDCTHTARALRTSLSLSPSLDERRVHENFGGHFETRAMALCERRKEKGRKRQKNEKENTRQVQVLSTLCHYVCQIFSNCSLTSRETKIETSGEGRRKTSAKGKERDESFTRATRGKGGCNEQCCNIRNESFTDLKIPQVYFSCERARGVVVEAIDRSGRFRFVPNRSTVNKRTVGRLLSVTSVASIQTTGRRTLTNDTK